MNRAIRERMQPGDPSEWRESLSAARIPNRFWAATTAAVRDPAVRQWAELMLAHPELWLGKGYGAFFHGPENTGKSALAAILAMEALRRIEQVLWLHVRDVPAVRFRENDEYAKVDDLLHHADLLVLDDLGAERFRMSSAAGPALEETVRILYERNRSVIVTSNFSWTAFGEHYSNEARPLVSVLSRIVIPVALTIPWPGEPGPDMPRVGV